MADLYDAVGHGMWAYSNAAFRVNVLGGDRFGPDARDARRGHASARDRRPGDLSAPVLRHGGPEEHGQPHVLRRPRRHVPARLLCRLPAGAAAARAASPLPGRRGPLASQGQRLPDPERERGPSRGASGRPARCRAWRGAAGGERRRVSRAGRPLRARPAHDGRRCPPWRVRRSPLERALAGGSAWIRRLLERPRGSGGRRLSQARRVRSRRQGSHRLPGRPPLSGRRDRPHPAGNRRARPAWEACRGQAARHCLRPARPRAHTRSPRARRACPAAGGRRRRHLARASAGVHAADVWPGGGDAPPSRGRGRRPGARARACRRRIQSPARRAGRSSPT